SINYRYFWSLLPGAITIAGNLAGGWWVYGNMFFSLGILTVIEWFFPEDFSNEQDETSAVPDLILGLHVVFQVTALITFFYVLSIGEMNGWQIFGASFSTGVHSGTSAIVIAHELIHRNSPVWRFFGKVLLFTSGNIYFYVEHLRVHHKWVATDRDPASAKRGENVYGFFLRSSLGQISGSWKLEKERLSKAGKSVWHPSNYTLLSMVLLFVLSCAMYYFIGPLAVVAFAMQCLLANFLLEYTNYIEHYGLRRNEKERATEIHSWQSDRLISRFLLIDLSRHADHHYYASKPYHTLVSHPGSPVLPCGYAAALYVALFPPAWFRMVDHRLDEFLEKHVDVSPS
ncbi:MAG: alkane 1-monooxygenase, partial [Bacteroidota bacterium]